MSSPACYLALYCRDSVGILSGLGNVYVLREGVSTTVREKVNRNFKNHYSYFHLHKLNLYYFCTWSLTTFVRLVYLWASFSKTFFGQLQKIFHVQTTSHLFYDLFICTNTFSTHLQWSLHVFPVIQIGVNPLWARLGMHGRWLSKTNQDLKEKSLVR